MAGDWIKMRVGLRRDPRVIWMADVLAGQRVFMNWLAFPVQQSCRESAYEHVTSDVTRSLCVTALLEVWGEAREQGHRDGDDLVVEQCDKTVIDGICGIPGVGAAMETVGWFLEADDDDGVFPNFFKEKEPPEKRHRSDSPGAIRTRRWREKQEASQAASHGVTDTVTNSVTQNVTERHGDALEERREEKSKTTPCSPPSRGTPSRGRRLPDDFVVPDELRAWARDKLPTVDVDVAVDQFKDYHRAKGSTMKDWNAALRNWLRNEVKFNRSNGARDDDRPF